MFNVRDVIRGDGLFLPPSEQKTRIPITVADIRTPVTEWTSATELMDLQNFLKEMVVYILSKADWNREEDRRAASASVSFKANEVPGLISSIDREVELSKRQAEVFDLMRCVRIIATFTTIHEHRQFFRQVVYQVDQIDSRKRMFYQGLGLHNDRLEEVKQQRKALEEEERRRMADEEAEEAYRREALADFVLKL